MFFVVDGWSGTWASGAVSREEATEERWGLLGCLFIFVIVFVIHVA